MVTEVRQTTASQTRMELKLDDLENRSRRNNLRLVGLPEAVKLEDLQYLFEVELAKSLGLDHKCRVERAHRIGPERSLTTGPDRVSHPPRQVIMRFLDFNDKAKLLRAYRKCGAQLQLLDTKILLFEEYSAEVAKKRRAIGKICSHLFNRKIRFRLQYPATLIVFQGLGPPRAYTSVEEADISPEHKG